MLSTGNARKNDGLDALATALAASRNEQLAAVDPEIGSEVLRLLIIVFVVQVQFLDDAHGGRGWLFRLRRPMA